MRLVTRASPLERSLVRPEGSQSRAAGPQELSSVPDTVEFSTGEAVDRADSWRVELHFRTPHIPCLSSPWLLAVC